MEEVTDPELLARLNAPTPKAAPKAVINSANIPIKPIKWNNYETRTPAQILQDELALQGGPASAEPELLSEMQSRGVSVPSVAAPPAAPSAAPPPPSGPQEVTDPDLLARLNTPDPVAPVPSNPVTPLVRGIKYLAEETPKKFATLGTGLIKGSVAAGMMPFELSGMISPDPNHPPFSRTGEMLNTLDPYLYKAQTPVEKVITAGGSAAPLALSENPALIAQALLSGGAGEYFSTMPMFKDNPEIGRVLGNLSLPTAGAIFEHAPTVIGGLLHTVSPSVGHAWTALMSKLGGTVADVPRNVPSAQTLYEMEQSGMYPKSQLDKLAIANRQKASLWGPDPPEPETGKMGMIAKLVGGLMKFGLPPMQQYELNPPAPSQLQGPILP